MKKDKATKTTMYLDAETYMQFKIYAITLNKSVSELVEQFMRETLKEMKKEKQEYLNFLKAM